MRALLAAMCCEKGDTAGNLARHLHFLEAAAAARCRIAVFPEMSLTGSVDPAVAPERLVTLSHPLVEALVGATGPAGVAALFGVAEEGPHAQPHITQVLADGGRRVGVYRKRHMGEGEEAFVAGHEPAVLHLDGRPLGVAICAESAVDVAFDEAAAAGAPALFFCAAPGLDGRRTDEAAWRAGFEWWWGCGVADVRRHAHRLGLVVAVVGQAGSTVDEDFPGVAALVDRRGDVVARLPDWREGTLIISMGGAS